MRKQMGTRDSSRDVDTNKQTTRMELFIRQFLRSVELQALMVLVEGMGQVDIVSVVTSSLFVMYDTMDRVFDDWIARIARDFRREFDYKLSGLFCPVYNVISLETFDDHFNIEVRLIDDDATFFSVKARFLNQEMLSFIHMGTEHLYRMTLEFCCAPQTVKYAMQGHFFRFLYQKNLQTSLSKKYDGSVELILSTTKRADICYPKSLQRIRPRDPVPDNSCI